MAVQWDAEKLRHSIESIGADENLLENCRFVRQVLAIKKNPPIDFCVGLNAVPILLAAMTKSDDPQIQFECAWALTNIASGTSSHTKVVVQAGALPAFVQMAIRSDSSSDVFEQCLWAIGNIAGDSVPFRDLVLQQPKFFDLMKSAFASGKVSVRENAAWVTSNLCRGKPINQMVRTIGHYLGSL